MTTTSNPTYILNTDGGSRGNPGVAGCGAVIADGRETILKKIAKPLGRMTNNEAEYWAVITGLEGLKRLGSAQKLQTATILVRLDSELVCKQINGEYQIKEEKLFPLFIKVWNLRVKDLPNVRFQYVPREQNKLADELANQAMDESGEKQGVIF